MSGLAVHMQDLSVIYGATRALSGVTASIAPGTITGLIGRNGAGKSTLLATLAAFLRPTSGSLRIEGKDPYENPQLMAATCLVRESGDFGDLGTAGALGLAAGMRAGFSRSFAEHLLERFGVPRRRSLERLSRGQRSAFGAAIGLASRAPLTLFDEVYLGMDAPTRYAFYDELLADYLAHPRTIVISSHLIEEVERLLENVLILHAGKVLLSESADTLRQRGFRVVGEQHKVEAFVAGHQVVAWQQLGRTTAATVVAGLEPTMANEARAAGLELEHLSIQDLFVHLTEPQAAGSETYPPAERMKEPA